QNLTPKNPSWPSQNVNVTGFGNFDFIPKTMQKTLAGEEGDYFAFSNLGVNLDAKVASFFGLHVGVAYFNTNKGQGDYSKNTGLMIDDAFFTIANFNTSPFFLEGGRFYLPFGQYDRYAAVPTLAQILSIARETGVQAGLANWHGITLSVYASQGQLKQDTDMGGTYKGVQGAINYGAALHYKHGQEKGFHFGAGAEYIYNILDTNALTEAGYEQQDDYRFDKAVGGVAAQGQIGYRWFTVHGQYVSALESSDDIYKQLYHGSDPLPTPVMGAKPSAWDAGASVKYKLFHMVNQVDFTYSRSYDTAGLYIFNSTRDHVMPKARYIASYTLNLNKNIYTQFMWAHDYLWGPDEGDTGRQGDDFVLRLGAKF
ncbi:MAG: LbtU family siderophore porin, partial [Gammaproteobacteria bacterium]|nr:LbtU family siderophore porin [Gammaproteobacteria bacterium]